MDPYYKVALIGMLAVMSPGPDFVLITRSSLGGSRLAGIFASIGLSTGILVHVAYCLTGITVILSQSPQIMHAIKIAGGIYLIWIGVQAIRSTTGPSNQPTEVKKTTLNLSSAFRQGFLTNVLNPKATLFIFSLFTQVVDPGTPLSVQALLGLELAVLTMLWFSFVAVLFSHSAVRKTISSIQRYVDRALGAVLVTWGLALFFTP